MNNIYIDCIHCGYLKLSSDEAKRLALRGELGGVVCHKCNEEAHLLVRVTTTMYNRIRETRFREITLNQLWDMLRNNG